MLRQHGLPGRMRRCVVVDETDRPSLHGFVGRMDRLHAVGGIYGVRPVAGWRTASVMRLADLHLRFSPRTVHVNKILNLFKIFLKNLHSWIPEFIFAVKF